MSQSPLTSTVELTVLLLYMNAMLGRTSDNNYIVTSHVLGHVPQISDTVMQSAETSLVLWLLTKYKSCKQLDNKYSKVLVKLLTLSTYTVRYCKK